MEEGRSTAAAWGGYDRGETRKGIRSLGLREQTTRHAWDSVTEHGTATRTKMRPEQRIAAPDKNALGNNGCTSRCR